MRVALIVALAFASPVFAAEPPPDERDVRVQAAITEIIQQRDGALARLANMAGDLAATALRVRALEAELAKHQPKETGK